MPLPVAVRRVVCSLRASLCVAALAGPSGAQGAAPPSPKWLAGITRVAYTDLPNSLRYGDWPEKVIEDFGKAGVQMMFSRVHNGSEAPGLAWKSAYGPVDPAMQGRDGTREVVALCHKRGIRYVAYYWAQREAASVGVEHPEWRALNSAGQPNGYYCGNTGYRELVRDRVVELVREVGVDGIFFDMYHVVGDACYCAACRAKFRAETGQEPPVREEFDSPLWQKWVEFRFRSNEAALLEYNRAIKAANPDAALLVNSWNAWVYRNPGNLRNSIRVAECVDGLLEETGWYDTVDPSFFASPAHMAFMNWHLAGLCKGKRAFMWGSPSVPGWMPLGYQEPAIRVMTMLTNGAVPAHSVSGRDAMARTMADIVVREPYTRNARIVPWCGLVMSEKTELWYGRDDPKNRYVKGIYGAFQAMLERHLPASLVTDRELETGLKERYRVLFMPNCAAMSDAEMETVRRYVRDGGSLVATYETSLYDERGRPRKDFGLADLFRARRLRSIDTRSMVAFGSTGGVDLPLPPDHAWGADPVIRRTLDVRDVTTPVREQATSVPLHSGVLLVAPTNGTASPLRLRATTRDTTTGASSITNTVALVESTYGKGRVIYIPYDISWSFFRYGHEYLGRIIELALRSAAPEPPPVDVEAPTIVEAMPQVQGDRLVVHLLNDISSSGRSQTVAGESLYVRREVIPIHGIRLTFRDHSYGRFRLIPSGKALEPAWTADGWRVTVPRLDLHCMVVAERGGKAWQARRGSATPKAPARPEPAAAPAGSANLLRDGSFEARDGAGLTAWHLAQPASGTVAMTASTDTPVAGSSCMAMRGASDWACGEGERIPVKAGATYLLRGSARATRGDVFLQISYWQGDAWLGMTQSNAVTTDGAWQACAAISEPDRFPKATHVTVSGTARGGAVEAWFDDLFLTEVAVPKAARLPGPARR